MCQKLVKLFIGALLFILVRMIPTPDGLTDDSIVFLAIFITSIYMLCVHLIEDYLIVLLTLVAVVLSGISTFSQSFRAFATSSVWILIGAFGFGAALESCGVLKRLALKIIKKFSGSLERQTLALYLLGILIAPIIPSASAKVSLMVPIANMIRKQNGFQKDSDEAVLLFAAIVIPSCMLFAAFMSGSPLCYIGVGLMSEAEQSALNWTAWLSGTWLWLLITAFFMYQFTKRYYRRREAQPCNLSFIDEELKKMGTISKPEKIALAVSGATLALLITEFLHGVDGSVVFLMALIILCCTGILTTGKFRKEIAWESIILNGGIIALGYLFSDFGWGDWLGVFLAPYIANISNHMVLILLTSIFIYLLRMFVLSQTAIIIIAYCIFSAVFHSMGIASIVLLFIILSSGALFLLPYQNAIFITAMGASKGEMVTHKRMIPISIAYMLVNLMTLALSFFWWQWIGWLP